jgi:hypothetical protein
MPVNREIKEYKAQRDFCAKQRRFKELGDIYNLCLVFTTGINHCV